MKRIVFFMIALTALGGLAWAQDAAAPDAGVGRKAPQLSDPDKVPAADAKGPSLTDTELAEAKESGPSAEVLAALETPKDKYGVPSGLYPLDLQLDTYRSSIKSGEGNATLFGIIGGICVGGGIALAIGVPELVWAPYGGNTGIPYGYFVAGVGIGMVGYDLFGILPGISKNKKAILKLYGDKYGMY